jgi:hypothetical protein
MPIFAKRCRQSREWILLAVAREERCMDTSDSRSMPATDERQTRELCGEERDRLRCIRPKGHTDEHEAMTPTEARTWK